MRLDLYCSIKQHLTICSIKYQIFYFVLGNLIADCFFLMFYSAILDNYGHKNRFGFFFVKKIIIN